MDVNVNCPVCGRDAKFCLVEMCCAQVDGEMIHYQMLKCEFCASSYAYPRVSARPDFYDYDVPRWRWEFGEFVSDLQELREEKVVLLEIGCNEGNFLNKLDPVKQLGYGIDFNVKAVSKARSKNLNCFAMTLDEFHEMFPNLRFDAIGFFHVLEHLEDPFRFLCSIAPLLKDSGILAFSVPHPHRLRLLTYREPDDYPPNHLTRFSLLGLRLILERAGFQVLKSKDHPRTLSLLSFISLCVDSVFRKMGIYWLFGAQVHRWLRVLLKLPVFIIISPACAIVFLKNRHLPGDALYLVCSKRT